MVRTEKAICQLHRSAQETMGHRLRREDVELLLSPHDQESGRNYPSTGAADRIGRDGASLLQPVRTWRRRAPRSGQERLLHRPQALPHGAGAEAVWLHAFIAVRRSAVGGYQQI